MLFFLSEIFNPDYYRASSAILVVHCPIKNLDTPKRTGNDATSWVAIQFLVLLYLCKRTGHHGSSHCFYLLRDARIPRYMLNYG
jgi:hypothetical protein